jgi:hypothetical protein
MAKRLVFNGVEIGFPSACVVCQGPAKDDFKISKIFSYGNRSITVTLPVPMCETHYQLAIKKNAAERGVGTAGLILGGLLGIAAAAALLAFWASSGQGTGILNIFMALFVGAGIFLVVWLLAMFGIAPFFADQDTKAARHSVKITRYWPANRRMQLEFYNEQIADRIARVNQDRIVQTG